MARRWIVIVALLVIGIALSADWFFAYPKSALDDASYVGRQTCAQCHAPEHEQWLGSHHDRAMEVASEESILGDFNDRTFTRLGVTSKFFRRDGKFFVNTEGPDGQYTDFKVKYTFGVDPLQQYMVELPGGKLQVLRVGWDVPQSQWFYVYPPDVPDERILPGDPMHWTGISQNWNTMCAECHSTDLRKNYDLESNTYHTTYEEIDVSCEACHGPGSLHVSLASARSLFWDRNVGYGLARLKGKATTVQIEACASCHSRRTMLQSDFRPGQPYLDYHEPSRIEEGLYHADGQILDEVYVYGSFLQSKMYHEGVSCTDCHNPHTAKLRFTGNRLCTQCHVAGKYDALAHHHHSAESAGGQCVECHMPSQDYMVIDPRRDHRFGVPRPDLTVALGTPNACANCHNKPEESAQWAADWVRKWYGVQRPNDPHWAAAVAAGRAGQPDAVPQLVDVVRRKSAPAIVRATAVQLLAGYSDPLAADAVRSALRVPEPLVRAAAARAYQEEQPQLFQEQLAPLLRDDLRAVRMAAASRMVDLPKRQMDPQYREPFANALSEYRESLLEYSERSASHLNLGSMHRRMGELTEAADSFRVAIRLEPYLTGPRSELASTLEALGQNPEEVIQLRREETGLLERDVKLLTDANSLFYRLGLMYYLTGEFGKAEKALHRAVELSPNSYDYLMTLALLQEQQQRWDDAVESLNRLKEMRPADPRASQIYQRLLQTKQAEEDGRSP